MIFLDWSTVSDHPTLDDPLLTSFPVIWTGWDMDPFVVISFGEQLFRAPVIQPSRKPNWEEEILSHVCRYEKVFKIQSTDRLHRLDRILQMVS